MFKFWKILKDEELTNKQAKEVQRLRSKALAEEDNAAATKEDAQKRIDDFNKLSSNKKAPSPFEKEPIKITQYIKSKLITPNTPRFRDTDQSIED